MSSCGNSCTIRVPASSANLGPGFDSFATALDLWLEVCVERAEEFSLHTDLPVPRNEKNILVQAFARYLSPARFRFTVSSQIPLIGGLGSSAAAVVAGLIAGRYFAEGNDSFSQTKLSTLRDELLCKAAAQEGHPDNAAAALYGGFVICSDTEVVRISVPENLAALLVVPKTPVSTTVARSVLPKQVDLTDAVFNVKHAACLAIALERGDLSLLAGSLRDRLHQPYRAELYPSSSALLHNAEELGALGVTISGAGPTALVWVQKPQLPYVQATLHAQLPSDCQLLATSFTAVSAQVT